MGPIIVPSILIFPSELSQFPNAILIDTRPPHAYTKGHIPSAVNIHDIFTYLAMTTSAGKTAMTSKFTQLFGAAGLSGSETAILYEEEMDTGFGQSCRGYVFLRSLGYPEEKIRILNGGFAAWVADGRAVTTDISSPVPKKFPVSTTGQSLLVDIEEMAALVQFQSQSSLPQNPKHNQNPTIILDTRAPSEWHGHSSSPYGRDFTPRKGRIPGSVWIEWRLMMEETPLGVRLKGKEGVMSQCAEVGIGEDSRVVVYCFKGARAANTLVALKEAGVGDVRLYMGSWNEWSRVEGLPVCV